MLTQDQCFGGNRTGKGEQSTMMRAGCGITSMVRVGVTKKMALGWSLKGSEGFSQLHG